MDYNQNNNQYNGYQPNVEPTYQPPQPPVEPNTQQPYYQAPVEPNTTQPQYNAPQYDNQYNTQQYGTPQYGAPQTPVYNQPATEEGKGMSIASLVLGILSVTCCCGGWLPSILAIVFGFIARNKKPENNTMALVGIILGAVGVVFSIISAILMATGSLSSMMTEFY